MLPGAMAAEVVGLPHQPQASFRVPEPVIAEAHLRLRTEQLSQQPGALVCALQLDPTSLPVEAGLAVLMLMCMVASRPPYMHILH